MTFSFICLGALIFLGVYLDLISLHALLNFSGLTMKFLMMHSTTFLFFLFFYYLFFILVPEEGVQQKD